MSDHVEVLFGSRIEDHGSLPCSKSLHMRLGRLGGCRRSDVGYDRYVNIDFGSSIKAKVSDLEGCHVANRCILGLGGWRSDMLVRHFGSPTEEKASDLEGRHCV